MDHLDEIALPNNWQPRPYQRKLWDYLEGGGKRAISIWHRRSGKDDVCLNWACCAAFMRPATYWHMLPDYSQGRKAIWTAVNPHTGLRRIDECFPRELRANTSENEMFIRFKNGATWQVVGSDRYDAAVGSPPAGVTFSEWALANPAAWGYLAPILLENNGWANFITTSRGYNHAKSMLDMARTRPDWFAEVLTVTDTGALSSEAVEAQRIEYHGIYGVEAGDALIEQEYFCSFEAAVIGSYYGALIAEAEREGRICDLSYDEQRPVHTAWDIGVGDAMSLWFFQLYPDRVHIIDHYTSHGHVISHYVDVKKCKGYIYGNDWVPHDAHVRDLSDIGDEHQLARQRVTIMAELGLRPRFAPLASIDDGISAVRVTLPKCWFDQARCRTGIDSLRNYKKQWDESKRCFGDKPLHDWASDDADAFRYLSLVWRFETPKLEAPPKPPVKEASMYTIDELWKMRGARRERV